MSRTLLEVREVSKSFGGLTAVNQVTLDLQAGQLWALSARTVPEDDTL